ncbi:MAG: hypothetical protein R3A13_10965 [Bdellovibrionota bacterium]
MNSSAEATSKDTTPTRKIIIRTATKTTEIPVGTFSRLSHISGHDPSRASSKAKRNGINITCAAFSPAISTTAAAAPYRIRKPGIRLFMSILKFVSSEFIF